MSDIPIEILCYEAKWGLNEPWQECTRDDYLAMIGSIHPHPYKCRVIGVVQDPAGLLLDGPKGFSSWREAAVREKARRVELERLQYDLTADGKAQQKLKEIREILDRDDG